MENLEFANGERVPPRLRAAYLEMRTKVQKTRITHTLVKIKGEIVSLPSPGDPGINAVWELTKAMKGKFYGCIIAIG